MRDVDAVLRFLKGAAGFDLDPGPEPIALLDARLIFDPASALAPWMALILFVVGLSLAGFGSRGMFKRLMIGIGAAIAGFFLAGSIPWVSPSEAASWTAAIVLGFVGVLAPPLGAAAGGALLGSWIAEMIAPDSSRPVLSQLVPSFLLALFFAFGSRWLAAVISSLLGSVVTVIAAIALLPATLQQTLHGYPAAPLLPMVVIACSGAAYQLARPKESEAEPEEEAERDPLSATWSPSR